MIPELRTASRVICQRPRRVVIRAWRDFAVLIFGAGLAIAASVLGSEAGRPATTGLGTILGGLYVVYLGSLFLLSYFFPGRCFIFSMLSYLCVACSWPTGRRMAWVYFGLCLAIGGSLVLRGFGVF